MWMTRTFGKQVERQRIRFEAEIDRRMKICTRRFDSTLGQDVTIVIGTYLGLLLPDLVASIYQDQNKGKYLDRTFQSSFYYDLQHHLPTPFVM